MTKDLSVKNSFLDKIRNGKPAVKKDQAVSDEKLRRAAGRAKKDKRKLLFSLDATASRHGAWEASQKITHSMFDSIPGELSVALSYHGGSRLKEFTEFTQSFKKFQDKLSLIECEAGATKLNDILENASRIEDIGAIVYIGDCYEESLSSGTEICKKLRINGCKLFIFQDKTDGENIQATHAFGAMVDVCGGALLDFNQQAIKEAEQLLTAITLYSAGGKKLLEEKKKLPGAKLLLEKMK